MSGNLDLDTINDDEPVIWWDEPYWLRSRSELLLSLVNVPETEVDAFIDAILDDDKLLSCIYELSDGESTDRGRYKIIITDEITSVKIHKSTRNELKKRAISEKESFEKIILRLLKKEE